MKTTVTLLLVATVGLLASQANADLITLAASLEPVPGSAYPEARGWAVLKYEFGRYADDPLLMCYSLDIMLKGFPANKIWLFDFETDYQSPDFAFFGRFGAPGGQHLIVDGPLTSLHVDSCRPVHYVERFNAASKRIAVTSLPAFDIELVGMLTSDPAPEPASLALLAFGGLALLRRRA